MFLSPDGVCANKVKLPKSIEKYQLCLNIVLWQNSRDVRQFKLQVHE